MQCKVKVNSLIFICLTVSVLLQSARCCDADKVSYNRAVPSVSSFRTLASVSVCQLLSIRFEKITHRDDDCSQPGECRRVASISFKVCGCGLLTSLNLAHLPYL